MKLNVHLPKGVKRITVLHAQEGNVIAGQTVYEAKKKRKKQTRGLRFMEKLTRRNARAYRSFADTYLDRHDRSNRKKRDGWMRDLGNNVFRANRKAMKKLELKKLMRG